jgi:predicted RNase H-like HicB family nuclease
MKRYEVVYERDESGWWVASVKKVGAITQGRTLDQARERIRDALESIVGEEARDATLVDVLRIDPRVRRVLAVAQQARQRAKDQQEKANAMAAEAAKLLTKQLGLGLRDAGKLLGVSFQRVHQLVEEDG